MTITNDDLELDLDQGRAASNEHKPKRIRVGGKLIDLPQELPIDVFEPLLDVDADVSLLFRQALDARETAGDNQMGLVSAVIDMLVVNPQLPKQLVEAVKEMARRLVGDEGYADLAAARLSTAEAGKIAKFLGRAYGVSLGEASPSSGSAEEGSGATSQLTSSGATDSTPEASGTAPATQAS